MGGGDRGVVRVRFKDLGQTKRMARLMNVFVIMLIVVRRASCGGGGGGGSKKLDRTVTVMVGILLNGRRGGGGGEVTKGDRDNFAQGPLSLTQCCKDLGVAGGGGSGTAVIVNLQVRTALKTVID